jgi:hypothetical protein
VAHRAFCVATAIALLTASSTAAWATGEDVGTPGPAILEDASGSSDALRFDQFAFKDLSVGSTLLGVQGSFVPIVGAGLEPSQEVQVDPGTSGTAFDYSLSVYYYSGAPDAIPPTVNNSDAVETIIQSEFMLNGAGDMMTGSVGATGYWPTLYGSSPLALSAVTESLTRPRASCSSDGSTSAVTLCVILEDRIDGLPTDGGSGAQAAYQSGQQSFGSVGAASPGFGAPTWPRKIVNATLSTAPIYFSLASEVTLPVFTAVSPPVLDLVIPYVNSNSGPAAYPPSVGPVIVGGTSNTPSVPELPVPALFVIGLVGIALARRVSLRPSARFG